MKRKSVELDVDFIGGERPLTKEDEIAISNFIRDQKVKRSRKHSPTKRTIRTSRRKATA
jgi:hypothetical protein